MLFQSPFYFVCLAIAAFIYWSIGNRVQARLYVIAMGSLGVFAYLLHENLQNQIAFVFIVSMATLVILTYGISKKIAQNRSPALMLLGLCIPFSVFLIPLIGSALIHSFKIGLGLFP